MMSSIKLNYLVCILVCVFLFKESAAQEEGSYIGVWQDSKSKNYALKLKNYKYVRRYRSLHSSKTKVERGVFEKHGDTLILNSDKQPDYYDLIKVEEFTITSDSIIIELYDENNSMYGLGLECVVRVNDDVVHDRNIKQNRFVFSKEKINEIQVISIGMFDYPIIVPKSSMSNYFKIILYDVYNQRNDKRLNGGDYLHNEMLIYKDNALLYKYEEGWSKKYIKMKK